MAIITIDGVSSFDPNLLLFIEQKNNDGAKAFFIDIDPQNLVDHYGFTLLHYAAYYNNTAMTKYFIAKGCDINAIDKSGNTPLLHATENGHREVIKILLDAKANVFLHNYCNESVFHISIKYLWDLYTDIIDIVFQTVRKRFYNDAHYLATNLLSFKLPFSQVVLFKDLELTNIMLEHEGSCMVNYRDSFGNNALHYAVAVADLKQVEMLIRRGINVAAKNNYLQGPLQFYNTRTEDTPEKMEILRILMNRGKPLMNGTYGNCMLEAILFHSGRKELIQTLLEWEVDFSARDEDNKTLAHIMAANDNPGITDILQSIKFDVNARDNLERNALWYAVNSSCPDVLEYLLKNGAEVNSVDRTGRTVLFYGLAIWPTHPRRAASLKCLELLLQYKANAQYVCNNVESVFHLFLRTVTRFELGYMVIAHLTMMEALGTPISDYIVKQIHSHGVFSNYFSLCKLQIRNMQSVKIYESISLFDILTSSKKKMTLYMRNRRLVFALDLFLWQLGKYCFSIEYYNKIYWERVMEARRHAKLRKSAGTVMSRVVNINYDHCIMDEILGYLDSRDLQSICLTNFEGEEEEE